MTTGQRNITDADAEAIVAAFKKQFYLEVGRGVWSIAWKVVLTVLIGIAAYGHFQK